MVANHGTLCGDKRYSPFNLPDHVRYSLHNLGTFAPNKKKAQYKQLARCQSGTMHSPAPRQAARALVVGPGPSVLLIGGRDPAVPDAKEFWVVPGGGMATGEAAETAARRELWEETGLMLGSLGPVVWERRVDFAFAGKQYSQDEYFFVTRQELFHPAPAQLTADEVAWVTTGRWWSLDDLETTGVDVHPPALVELVRNWLAEGPPPRPLRIH
jgi:8-oxo-dGTP pyrophosphatase MutT (NUDIX family)